MTHPYDRWLMQDPEDDLPPWMYELVECPVCGYVDTDSIPGWAEWNGGICTCDDDGGDEE